MEPPLERGARQIVKLADALQAKSLEQAHDLLGKAQGFDRKRRKRFADLSLRDDEGRDAPVARERVSASQGFGQGKPRGEAEMCEALRHGDPLHSVDGR